jgi:anti-sigma B factor antagonist
VTLIENVRIAHEQDACVVTLSGDLDELTAPAIVEEAVAAVTTCPDNAQMVVIDMYDVRFMGSAGIGALVDIRNAAMERNALVSLRGVPPNIARVLTIVGLNETFGITR